jgi:Xaa-Pro aminopeptidase
VVGQPTDEQQRLYDTYLKAQQAVIDQVKPGMKNKAIDDIAKAVYEDNGFGEYFVFGFSHSIGLMFEETPAPTIHPMDGNVELKADMTITAGHSVLSVPGIGGVRIEDTLHLTEQGAIPLTSFSKTLEIS